MIGLRTSVGRRPHWVTFTQPGKPMPDGDGGIIEGSSPLDPPGLFVEIASPVANDERLAPGTTVSSSTRILTGPYHPQVNTQTVIGFLDLQNRQRTFNVIGDVNIDERNVEMILTCEERDVRV